jgi:myo-inositol catabolism protein IolS
MEWRQCGRSDLRLPLLGVGTWSFGGGADDYWGEQSQREAEAVVGRAIDLECAYFDTAQGYNDGRSESALGQLLKGRRDRVLIGTKISPTNTRPEALREHCEASLARLQTDRIDVYMVHWPMAPPLVQDAFATLQSLRDEGKIRYIGVSNFGVQQMREARTAGADFVVDQLGYNLFFRAVEHEILPFCQAHGIGIIGYMPLLQGILSGKYGSPERVPPLRARTRHFSSSRPGTRHGEAGAEAELFTALGKLDELATETGVPMSDLALAWCAAQPALTCVLAGARNVRQLEANVRGVSVTLSPEIRERLNTLSAPLAAALGPNPDMWCSGPDARIR